MPVLVTGAEAGAGGAALRALLRRGGEVRAWLDAEVVGEDDAAAFTRMGAKTAVGELDDEGRLELALEQVHTVVHLWGGPLAGAAAELDTVASVLSAAIGAGCRRFVWASHLGAHAPEGHPYLQACAEAEQILADAPLESVVVRRALTYGPDDAFTRRLAASADRVSPEARHAPLWLADLGRAVADADALERGTAPTDLHVVIELAGPTVVPLGAIAGGMGLPSAGVEPLPAEVLSLYARDLEPGPTTLGREGTPFAEGVAALRR